MPLQPDGLDRGTHAIHVHAHPKLAKHRTVINAAWLLINQFADRTDVVTIDLGRIVKAKGGHRWKRVGIHCQQKGRLLHMMCVTPEVMQFIALTFRVGTDLHELASEIEKAETLFRCRTVLTSNVP